LLDRTREQREVSMSDTTPHPVEAGSHQNLTTPVVAGRNPMDAYLASLSPNGARAMRERLRAVARLIGVEAPPGLAPEEALRDHWHTLPFERVERIRQALLARGAAPSTVNLTLAALRGIARYARRFGLITLEDERNLREVAGAKGQRPPAGRALATAELAALARACVADAGPAGGRDLALLAIWRVAGLRRAELADLLLGDYRPGDLPTLVIRRGKGNKGRELPLNADAATAVGRWLRVRGRRDGALFCRIDKWGNLDPARRGLSPHALYKLLLKRAEEAGIAHASPHDFRRTAIGDILDAGHDLATAQQLAGHASPVTTARYDRRSGHARARATADLRFPVPDAAALTPERD